MLLAAGFVAACTAALALSGVSDMLSWFLYVILPGFSLAVLLAGFALIGRRPGWLAAVAFVPIGVAIALFLWMLVTQEQTLLPNQAQAVVLVPMVGAALWGSLSRNRTRGCGRLALLGLVLPLAAIVLLVQDFRMWPPMDTFDYGFTTTCVSSELHYHGHVYANFDEVTMACRWGTQPLPRGYSRTGAKSRSLYLIAGHPDLVSTTAWGGGFVLYEVYRLVPDAQVKQQ